MGKKISRIISILLAAVILLAACSSTSSSGKTTIKYWSMWNKGEPQQVVIQKIIDAYEDANPNVKVDVQWMGREVMSKVRNAALSGDAPDLTEQSGAEVEGALIKNKLAEPLNELLSMKIPNEETPFQDVFIDEVLPFYQQGEDTYFIPYEIISSGFHYNENLFKEYGVKPPATWDEFVEVNKTFKSKGLAPLAQDGNIDFYNAYYYYWLVERLMGPGTLVEAAGDKTGETWGQPGYLEAAKKVQELVDNKFFADGYKGSQYPAAQTAWASGKSAMVLVGSWLSSETAEYSSKDFVYKAFPFPSIEGGKGGKDQAELYLIGWVAPKGADKKAVQDFLAFAMQKKYQEGIVKDTKNISTRKDLEAPEALADFREIVVNASSFHKEYDGLQAEYPDWWKTVFLPLDDKLIFGEMKAEEFINELQKQTKDFWSKK
ncbi:ABC transporter substrate-binding protein [Neobacillus kokaensis]|uniref:Sugar-binding protein n=1 Tax=Neobacillus kokaensis TaxID=2759023 RepID=A0ABQ3N9C8_9BACI|nr:extracellular solute-binding protein [Neobacillus kokaensis]GHI00388.1 sugar-binding protein [Neobacillus kokaensis]